MTSTRGQALTQRGRAGVSGLLVSLLRPAARRAAAASAWNLGSRLVVAGPIQQRALNAGTRRLAGLTLSFTAGRTCARAETPLPLSALQPRLLLASHQCTLDGPLCAQRRSRLQAALRGACACIPRSASRPTCIGDQRSGARMRHGLARAASLRRPLRREQPRVWRASR